MEEVGAPYSHFLMRTQTESEIPDDHTHKTVLAPLTSAGVCTLRKKRGRPLLIVNLGYARGTRQRGVLLAATGRADSMDQRSQLIAFYARSSPITCMPGRKGPSVFHPEREYRRTAGSSGSLLVLSRHLPVTPSSRRS